MDLIINKLSLSQDLHITLSYLVMEMKSENDTFEAKLQESMLTQNMGEMKDADAIGTVGNADCGDMVNVSKV